MGASFSDVRTDLHKIASDIQRAKGSSFPKAKEWGGADVVLRSNPISPDKPKGAFYPEPRIVVTRYSGELSYLFVQLRDAFAGVLDGTTKIEFFGRLAMAAKEYLRTISAERENVSDLLHAVLHEAFAILEEMEDGEFRYLLVAGGNTIWADLVRDAESAGYLGVEATREFFAEMENEDDAN